MTLYRNDIKADLEALGYKEGTNFTMVDGANDQAKQTEQIDSFIAEGVDGLIVNLVQSTSASTIIEKAKAADIPVVFINREPTAEDLALYDKCCYVGADARQSGTFQGEIIAATENKGDFNGNGTVDYAMIMGDPENVDAQYRTEYSIKALEDAGLKVNKLYEQRADWDQTKGQENAANVLSQFNNEVDVIFCNNDAMAMGALQAIEDSLTAISDEIGEEIYIRTSDAKDRGMEVYTGMKEKSTELAQKRAEASIERRSELLARRSELLQRREEILSHRNIVHERIAQAFPALRSGQTNGRAFTRVHEHAQRRKELTKAVKAKAKALKNKAKDRT